MPLQSILLYLSSVVAGALGILGALLVGLDDPAGWAYALSAVAGAAVLAGMARLVEDVASMAAPPSPPAREPKPRAASPQVECAACGSFNPSGAGECYKCGRALA